MRKVFEHRSFHLKNILAIRFNFGFFLIIEGMNLHEKVDRNARFLKLNLSLILHKINCYRRPKCGKKPDDSLKERFIKKRS